MTIYTESFNQADSSTVGPDQTWTEDEGAWATASNKLVRSDIGTGFIHVTSNSASSADMFSEVVAEWSGTNEVVVGPMVRFDPSTKKCYGLYIDFQVTTVDLIIAYFANGFSAFSTIASATGVSYTSGSKLRLSAVGTTITAYVDDVQVLTTTDSNITTGGVGGVLAYMGGGGSVMAMDSFRFGDGDGGLPPDYPYFVDKSAQVTGTSTTLTPTVPAGVATGDVVFAHITGDNNSTLTPPTGEGWALAPGTTKKVNGTGLEQAIYFKVWGAGATDDTTPTFTSSSGSGGWGITLSVFRNCDTTTPVQAGAEQSNAASNTITAASASYSGDNCTYVRFFGSSDDNNHGSPSEGVLGYGGTSYDQTTGSDYAQSMSYRQNVDGASSTGTATMTEGSNGPDVSIGQTLVLQPPVVGGIARTMTAKMATSSSTKTATVRRGRPLTAKAATATSGKTAVLRRGRKFSAKTATSNGGKATAIRRAVGYQAKNATWDTYARVTRIGNPNTFPGLDGTYTTDAAGNHLAYDPEPGFKLGKGKAIWFMCQTSDGIIHWGGQPLTINVFKPTGTTLETYSYDPVNKTLKTNVIPTTLGETSELSLAYAGVGGADIEDAQVYFDGSGVEHVIMSVGRPHNDWNLAAHGIYPSYVVLTKTAGVWAYDATLSKTSAQVAASGPGGTGGNMYPVGTTPVTGESFTDNRHATQMCVLSGGKIAIGHFDPSSTLGFWSGGFSVLNKDMTLAATFQVPNVTHPDDDQQLQLSPRAMRAAPAGDRWVVVYDVFPHAAPPGTNMLTLQGLTTESDFETSLGTWAAVFGTCTLTRDNTVTIDGSWEMKMLCNSTAAQALPSSRMRVETGCGYTATAKVRAATTGNACRIGIAWYDDSNAFISQDFGSTSTDTNSGATTVTVTATAPQDAAYAAVTLSIPTTTAGEIHYWDTVTLKLASTGINRRFMAQEFAWNGTNIVPKSKPFWTNTARSYPHMPAFDEAGNLWLFTFFGGVFNDVTCVYEFSAGERSYVTSAPSASFADAGATTEWAAAVTPTYKVAGSAVGGTVVDGPQWDNVAKRMWLTTVSIGSMYITRSGASGSYTFSVSGAYGQRDADMSLPTNYASLPVRTLWDTTRSCLWVGTSQQYTGATYPISPAVVPQWLVKVEPSLLKAGVASNTRPTTKRAVALAIKFPTAISAKATKLNQQKRLAVKAATSQNVKEKLYTTRSDRAAHISTASSTKATALRRGRPVVAKFATGISMKAGLSKTKNIATKFSTTDAAKAAAVRRAVRTNVKLQTSNSSKGVKANRLRPVLAKVGTASSSKDSLRAARKISGKLPTASGAKGAKILKNVGYKAKLPTSNNLKELLRRATKLTAKAGTSDNSKAAARLAKVFVTKLPTVQNSKENLRTTRSDRATQISITSSAKVTALRRQRSFSAKISTATGMRESVSRLRPVVVKLPTADAAKATPLRRGVGQTAKLAAASNTKETRINRLRKISSKVATTTSTRETLLNRARPLTAKAPVSSSAKGHASGASQRDEAAWLGTATSMKVGTFTRTATLVSKLPNTTGTKPLQRTKRPITAKMSAANSAKFAGSKRLRNVFVKLATTQAAKITTLIRLRRITTKAATTTSAKATLRSGRPISAKLAMSSGAKADLTTSAPTIVALGVRMPTACSARQVLSRKFQITAKLPTAAKARAPMVQRSRATNVKFSSGISTKTTRIVRAAHGQAKCPTSVNKQVQTLHLIQSLATLLATATSADANMTRHLSTLIPAIIITVAQIEELKVGQLPQDVVAELLQQMGYSALPQDVEVSQL